MAPRQRRLTGASNRKSPDHYAKGTPSPLTRANPKPQIRNPKSNPRTGSDFEFRISDFGFALVRRAPTACRHVVSGSLSSPGRGSSHLSLALLGTLSVAGEYLSLRDAPRGFEPASTCPVLLRCQTGGLERSRTGLSPAMVAHSRAVLLTQALITPSH